VTTGTTTSTLHQFEAARPRLFGIAYRMLGSATEADDVLQDAWLRWQATTDDVQNPIAYLTTITTRLCLTALDSARARRETYIGPWLPEPVDTSADPLLGAERAEALSLAVLLLLERLSPAERAAYVLHEAFDYPFSQIAELLDVSEANARQLGKRAREHIDRERGTVVSAADRERMLGAFLLAAQTGNLAALEAALAEDALSLSDGGGLVTAARKPIVGRERVAHFILGVLDKRATGMTTIPVVANGEPAILAIHDGKPLAIWNMDIGPTGLRRLMIAMNPTKLQQFSAAALSHS
jgi:RNA polymerase sigma-70 factor, ECF subfamily